MTGANGAPLGVRLLEQLRELPEVETHLVLSRWARATVELETGLSVKEIGKLADFTILSQDIMTIPVQDILATKVHATVIDGEVVYGDI